MVSTRLLHPSIWLTVVCAVLPAAVAAQTAMLDSVKVSPAITKGASPMPAAPSKPLWSELTPLQQQALQPLAGTWSTISEAQKRKWLAISKNYPSLPPDGQSTMHGRMNEWVSLSPLQRAQARLNFATTKELSRQLTPEEKLAKWQTYQSLSPDEKQKLAEKASVKPSGAAVATKPVPPQKLAPVQPHPSASTALANRKLQGGLSPAPAAIPARAASAP